MDKLQLVGVHSPDNIAKAHQKKVVPISSSHSKILGLDMACFGFICMIKANLYYFGGISA